MLLPKIDITHYYQSFQSKPAKIQVDNVVISLLYIETNNQQKQCLSFQTTSV